MKKPNSSKTVRCVYFTWKIFRRGAVYYADGRGNQSNLGKHSLSTKTEVEALQNLQRLDKIKAIAMGLIPSDSNPHLAADGIEGRVTIEDGWKMYLEHIENLVTMGQRSPNTLTRYKELREKHLQYCKLKLIAYWSDFHQDHAENYVCWLIEKIESKTRTWTLAMTTVLSVFKWLITRKLLDAKYRIHVSIPKPTGTDTYCYSREEVVRMLEVCQLSHSGRWLRQILITLANTGMRISDLSNLRWSDIDFDAGVLRIKHEPHTSKRLVVGRVRTTKGKRDRTVPINKALKEVLQHLKKYDDGFVFHGPRGAVIRPKNVLPVLKRVVIKVLKHEFPTPKGEVGFEHGTIHSFRHFFVSEMFRLGFSEIDIKDWVGHRDSVMVHHYRHLRPGESQRRMQSLDLLSDDNGSSEN